MLNVKRDLEVAAIGDWRLLLDLYLPRQQSALLPVIAWIHGGSWISGSKNDCPLASLALAGFAVASLSYRLSSRATFPAQIHDCKATIRWLRAHAAEHGLDGKRIGVCGASAGGHLAALLGTSDGDINLDGTLGGNLDFSTHVSAVCDLFGPTDLAQHEPNATPYARLAYGHPDGPISQLLGGPLADNAAKARLASPIHYANATSAPFLILHGDRDELVPLYQSQELADRLRAAGVDVNLHVIPGAGHGTAHFFSEDIRGMIMQFFSKHLRR